MATGVEGFPSGTYWQPDVDPKVAGPELRLDKTYDHPAVSLLR